MDNAQELQNKLEHRGDEPHLLRDIVRTNQVLMMGFSRIVGMPSSRFGLLRLLVMKERDLGIMDISRQLGVNPAAVTRQVKSLEDEGLVERIPDERDARRNVIELTTRGKQFFETFHVRNHDLEREFLNRVTQDEISTAVTVLEKLRNFIEDLY